MSIRRKKETKDGLHTIKVKSETFEKINNAKGAFETYDELFMRVL